LTALLAGQRHSRRRSIRDQRGFAMLAMKENVRVGCNFAQRMFRRFHSKGTSRACAEGRRAIRQTREITPKIGLNFSRLLACLAEVLNSCRNVPNG
jgi:hypothetical protein